MTNEKLKSIFQFYLDTFASPLINPQKLSDQGMLCRLDEGHNHTTMEHMYYMCVEAQKLVDEGRVPKAMRWLGFVQGVLWSAGLYSLDELKNHSRPDVEEEKNG